MRYYLFSRLKLALALVGFSCSELRPRVLVSLMLLCCPLHVARWGWREFDFVRWQWWGWQLSPIDSFHTSPPCCACCWNSQFYLFSHPLWLGDQTFNMQHWFVFILDAGAGEQAEALLGPCGSRNRLTKFGVADSGLPERSVDGFSSSGPRENVLSCAPLCILPV